MTVKEIFEFLNKRFPVSDAMEFDNVGLLLGDMNSRVSRALVALDCDLSAVKTAVDSECQLIVTHHPVVFSPLKNILAGSVQYELIRHNISVISMHTNLDVGTDGVNETLCRAIGLVDVAPWNTEDGYRLQSGAVFPIMAEDFAHTLKATLNGGIRFVDGGKEINKVLVCSGSGGDYISEAIRGGFDALVTADVKHHQFLTAADNRISLFDAGHYATEDIIVEPLAKMLVKEFDEINFITHHPNILKFA